MVKRKRQNRTQIDLSLFENDAVSLLAEQYDIAISQVPIKIEDINAHKTRRRRPRKTVLSNPESPFHVRELELRKCMKKTKQETSIKRAKSLAPREALTSLPTTNPDASPCPGEEFGRPLKPRRRVGASEDSLLGSRTNLNDTLPPQHGKGHRATREPPFSNLSHARSPCAKAWSTTSLPYRQVKQWRKSSLASACRRESIQEAPPGAPRETSERELSGLELTMASCPYEPVSKLPARLRKTPFRDPHKESTFEKLNSHGGDRPTIISSSHNVISANVSQRATAIPTYFNIGSLEDARKRLKQPDDESDDETAGTSDAENNEITIAKPHNVTVGSSRRQICSAGERNKTFVDPEKTSIWVSQQVDHKISAGQSPQPILPEISQLHETIHLHEAPRPTHYEGCRRSSSGQANTAQSIATLCEEDIAPVQRALPALPEKSLDLLSDDEAPDKVLSKKQKATKSKSHHFPSQTKRKIREAKLRQEQPPATDHTLDNICNVDIKSIIPEVGDKVSTSITASDIQTSPDGAAQESRTINSADGVQLPRPSSTRRLMRTKSKTTGITSDYFISENVDRVDRPNRKGVTEVTSHPITDDAFGIVQEKTWSEPFWLLIAVKFLNVTRGRAAIPIFWELKAKYPTPEHLAIADHTILMEMTRPLGLQKVRSIMMIQMAKAWIDRPPVSGTRFRTLHYPDKGNGKLLKKGAVLQDNVDVSDGALELGGFPGCNRYAYDSWRIFCRDACRGVAADYKGAGASEEFQPEWKRVVPQDKELRAFLAWMWLREGWVWNYITGEKVLATDEQMEQARLGTFGKDLESAAQLRGKKIMDLDGAVDSAVQELDGSGPGFSEKVELGPMDDTAQEMSGHRTARALEAVEIVCGT